ncbi:caspase family protein [Nostoc sp. CALU 1950]|uniref:caspase family protein n=1 Tax=Nostoc sp. CALU 1950 TaxID=3104321 RepID=UPI003EBE81A6
MGKNWAIVVGINNYDNLQPLKYAKRDAEVMKAWFEDEAKFDEVFLFTEDSPAIKTNPPIQTQPTQGRFKRFLNAQFEEPLLKAEDNLWFFFAGHGKRYVDQDYLMFLDSDPIDYTTAISVDYVTQRLRRCGADNVVLLIDACRDEGDRSGLGVGAQEQKGVITFYSCAPSQKSWEIDELQHGSFTYSLLEGLRIQGEANCATVERLEQYLRYRVPQLNAYYKKSEQNPYLKAEPPYKMYYILVEQAARIKDAESLKYQALLAETEGDLLVAEQLWIRVLAVSRADRDAIRAIQRIAQRQIQPVNSISETLSITQPVAAPGGDRAVVSEPFSYNELTNNDLSNLQLGSELINAESVNYENISNIIGDKISSDNWGHLLIYLQQCETSDYINEQCKLKIKNYIDNLTIVSETSTVGTDYPVFTYTPGNMKILLDVFAIDCLKTFVTQKLRGMSLDELWVLKDKAGSILLPEINPILEERLPEERHIIIENFINSNNFKDANYNGSKLSRIASYLKPEEWESILKGFCTNSQIYGAWYCPDYIGNLFEKDLKNINLIQPYWLWFREELNNIKFNTNENIDKLKKLIDSHLIS